MAELFFATFFYLFNFREGIINFIMFGLLTYPSNEFDLKNIAATIVHPEHQLKGLIG